MTIKVTDPATVSLIKGMHDAKLRLQANVKKLVDDTQSQIESDFEQIRLQLGVPSLKGLTLHYYPESNSAYFVEEDPTLWKA